MSIVSELKKRAGHRVRIRAASPDQSSSGGEAVRMLLIPPTSRRLGHLLEVARLLVRTGVTVRTAKKVTDELSAGRVAYVQTPSVTDYERVRRSLMSHNVAVHQIKPRKVDVKALRIRIGISQEAFAGRYGLDVATVRNWEQGRTEPEGPAATLLQLIDRDPEEIVRLLAS